MCPSETIRLLNHTGMELSNQGHHEAALIVLARALRRSLPLRTRTHEAIVRNNIALVLSSSGKQGQARRQLARALALIALGPGSRDPLYGLLWKNYIRLGTVCGRGTKNAS